MRYQIRAVKAPLTKNDLLEIAALLIKAGYSVRITTAIKPNAKTKETVVEYWEDER